MTIITTPARNEAMTHGQWKKAQAALDRPVSFENDGVRLRATTGQRNAPRPKESVLDGVLARVHGKRVKL